MNTQKLQKYRDRIAKLNARISADMEELESYLEEYEWQEEELGVLLDENRTDRTYEEYYALEEVQKLTFLAAEHLSHIIARES